MCAASISKQNEKGSMMAGSSSQSRAINIDKVLSQTCSICYDESVKKSRKFVTDCFHVFCVDCFTNYIVSKINEKAYPIICPVISCKHRLSPYDCLSLLEDSGLKDENEQLSVLIIEYEMKEKVRYCANKKCSTPFEWNVDQCNNGNGRECHRAVCPTCGEATCVECRELWHVGMTCEQFKREKRRLNVDKLNELATMKGWKNCPHCNRLIEKIGGCNSITCRCNRTFHYGSYDPSYSYYYGGTLYTGSKVEREKNFDKS